DRPGLARKHRLEQRSIALDRLDSRDGSGLIDMTRAQGAHKSLLDLILQVSSITRPVLDEVQSSIQYGWRVATMPTMLNADRLGERVGSIEGGLVARRAADVALQRPPRIEEQLPSQLDAGGRRGRGGDAERLGQRFEECLRLLEKTRVVLRAEL